MDGQNWRRLKQIAFFKLEKRHSNIYQIYLNLSLSFAEASFALLASFLLLDHVGSVEAGLGEGKRKHMGNAGIFPLPVVPNAPSFSPVHIP